MESIPYRNGELLVKTIPKGTLLFRLTKTPTNDTRGVPVTKSTRCITPNFNVYFHPNPFVGHHIYKEYAEEVGDTVYIYVLTKDIKVILLVNPSKYTRMDRLKKGIFLKPCSTVRKGCMPSKGKDYDACLSDTIIKKFPDIVGMLGISVGDNSLMRKAMLRGIRAKTQKMFKKVKDASNHMGIPELILHPLTKRPAKDIVVSNETELNTNYTLLKKVPYNEDALHTFMNKHATYNPDIYFYTYKSNEN
jgi:hypothetical protein